MRKYHIIGINNSSVHSYKFLKKQGYKTTISDRNKLKYIKTKINLKNFNKDFFFENHPKKILKSANQIIFSTGVIKNLNDYKIYHKKKKNISQLDLFNKLNKWPTSKILMVTGSRGKTTLCRSIFNQLNKNKVFRKIIYVDRKNMTFSNIPKYKKNSFLIAEVDYQLLAISKKIKSKYRIITSFFFDENKAFKSKELYLKAKLKIFNDLKLKDFVLVDYTTFKKLKKNIKIDKKKIILIRNSNSIKKTNNKITSMAVETIKRNLNEKY